ncbi:DUF1361 domain-containing protein [Leadbettera azotonutricia]|uniref:Putative membrane protein n=1 Tax=Leadbettera azotonutricia (strain ATCC BAA-888 / DSM 13862 / ZAS-9) TaxID=545695 RepID=F5Y8Q7_LEAAZ|nr:DUF1361 domain-containing protein [Leadbettera azotonutricia]AEF80696.1 putative membrane protein [Leadbettera azotonutricia ZAS-9]
MNPIRSLKRANRLYESVFMLALSLFCFGASVFRYIYTGTRVFLFLNWNLFLAFVPWALTSVAVMKTNIQHSKITIGTIMLFWLIFFPNAPYIFTDLFHLRQTPSIPDWFDLILILSFAWTGLLFGILSLWDIEGILSRKIKWVYIKIISTLLLFAGSFGVYLGRYLRWNSWDIITRPFKVLNDIGARFINPFEHQTTWGMTIFMGLFLNIIYWSFYIIRKRNK